MHVADGASFPSVSGPWIDARPDGTATIAWMNQTDDGRSVWAARIGPEGVIHAARRLIDEVDDQSVYEFLMLDHDAAGRAFIVFVLDTGDCTQTTPAAPGRNAQCVWLLRETP